MSEYIVTIKYKPKSMFDSGQMKFRQPANDETQAKELVKKHSLYPIDGQIIRVRYAAYKNKKL